LKISLAYSPGNSDKIFPFEFLIELLYQFVSIRFRYIKLFYNIINPYKTVAHMLFPPFPRIFDKILFSVGILSGRLPIRPGGRAITVTRDGYSVVAT